MRKLKVLIIEDESIISLHLENSLNLLGYEVSGVAKNSSHSLQVVEQEVVDIALVDINIDGDIDGIQTAHILNKTYNIPIIFISANKDKETLTKVSKVDFVGFIVKPFREDELETMLNIAIIKYDLEKSKSKLIVDNCYSYCFEKDEIYQYEQKVKLTSKEQKLLKLLLNAKGSVVQYDVVDTNIWQDKAIVEATRRQLFHRLKTKLPNFPFDIEVGIGYKVNL